MKEKPWIMILTHGNFGEELVRSTEMIVGKIENVCAFTLLPEMSPAEFMAKVRSKLDSIPEGTLVLTDLFGGTPTNIIAALSNKYEVHIVTGLNIGMLIEADFQRTSLEGEKLAEYVRGIGSDSCKLVNFKKEEM